MLLDSERSVDVGPLGRPSERQRQVLELHPPEPLFAPRRQSVPSPSGSATVATGNITNDELMACFEEHLATIVDAFDDADMVELSTDQLVVRPRARTSAAPPQSEIWTDCVPLLRRARPAALTIEGPPQSV